MSVMPVNNQLTREDLYALPDDGRRHELIDGAFFVTPAPGVGHQRMAFALARVVHASCAGSGLEVLLGPLDVVLGPNVVQPDIVVAASADFTERGLPVAPLLVIEIRSASTASIDEGRKRALYEEHGVASYWLADPATPSITVLELADGRYVQRGPAVGNEAIGITAPCSITLNPAVLAGG